RRPARLEAHRAITAVRGVRLDGIGQSRLPREPGPGLYVEWEWLRAHRLRDLVLVGSRPDGIGARLRRVLDGHGSRRADHGGDQSARLQCGARTVGAGVSVWARMVRDRLQGRARHLALWLLDGQLVA